MVVIRQLKEKARAILVERVFTYSGSSYQRDRFTKEKYELISSHIDMSAVGNVLDVGCNEGYITREFSRQGKFCVGIDRGPLFLNQVLSSVNESFGGTTAAYGVFPLDDANIDSIPRFDLILLLSVHHQLVKLYGDDYAQRVVRLLVEKATTYFAIEFAAITDKYGYDDARFTDNDDASIMEYAEQWLSDLGVGFEAKFLGKNRENTREDDREPYRYCYLLTRQR